MTAMTLDTLSGGRFILGIGPSGPQVVEGWHGEIYGKPLTRTREYVAIVRQILKRESPLEFEGEFYHIPNRRPGSIGLGKPPGQRALQRDDDRERQHGAAGRRGSHVHSCWTPPGWR